MEIANVIVSLGGDGGNTVPKFGVTAAEIAVLRAIHGEDAVHDIEPIGDKRVNNREELSRLKLIYGGAKDGNQNAFVDLLYPGIAARIFETLEELDLPEEFFKAETRVRAPKKTLTPAVMPKGLSKKEQAAWKKEQDELKAKTEAAAEDDAEDEDDGIDDLDDNVLG